MEIENICHSENKKKRRLSNEGEIILDENNSEVFTKKGKRKCKPAKRHIPKFQIKAAGNEASLEAPSKTRVPLTLTDVQHLLLHSLLGNLNISQSPRWYTIDKCNHISQTTCLIIEGLSIRHWEDHQDNVTDIKNIFKAFVEILTPSVYDGSLVKELALVPLSEVEKESIIQKYGSMNLALEARKDLMVMMKAVFPISNKCDGPIEISTEEKFPRTQLILSAWQLIEENYPVPLKGKLETIYSDYVLSKEEYAPVTATSPMFGLDCEMCITNAGSELTRVSLVNEKHETIYESFVRPYNNIIDYLTRYSGVTKTMLESVTKRVEDVQKDLRDLLPPDAILVGQSLNSDLHALKMMHPYVIDTSLIYNFTGVRTRKPKLRTLAREFLNEDIQSGKAGHCSVEDSIAALKLVQLKLSKSIEFGDAVHTNRQQYKENAIKMSVAPQYALSIFNHIIEEKKTSLVIGCDNITGDYHTYLTQAKESLSTQFKKVKSKKVKLCTVDNSEEVISTAIEAVNDYNLVMAHLKNECNKNDELIVHFKNISKWVKTIWENLKDGALFVVILGGTLDDNGLAMIRIKNTKG